MGGLQKRIFSMTTGHNKMSTDTKVDRDFPKTWSADHSSGVEGSASQSDRERKNPEPKDEGIRPEDLNTENDQGAA
jgi:hypothetical protein